jgi:hypothetical protein
MGGRQLSNLAGRQFGRLTVLGLAPRDSWPRNVVTGYLVRSWRTACACGRETSVPTSDLTGGKRKSCGCRCPASHRAARSPERCAECGSTFQAVVGQRYCSTRCRERAYSRAAWARRPKPVKPPRRCEWCGSEFSWRRRDRRFCSRGHESAAWSAKHRRALRLLRAAARLGALAEELEARRVMGETYQKEREEIRALTTPQLREEFAAGIRVSVQHLVRTALVLQELESRGERVDGADEGLLDLLRRIATGRLLPQIIVRFAGSPQALERAARLAPDEQRAVLADPARQEEMTRRRRRRADDGDGKPVRPRATGRHPEGEDLRNPLMAAEVATPKDLAELIVAMIRRSPEAEAVWRLVRGDPALRRLEASARRRQRSRVGA